MRLLSRTCVLTHVDSTAADSSGRPVSATSSATLSCGYRRTSDGDRLNGGDIVTDEFMFYFAPSVTVAAGDVIELDDAEFTVVADPYPAWNHRAGVVHHLEVRARRRHR